jgi:hypothetical protein
LLFLRVVDVTACCSFFFLKKGPSHFLSFAAGYTIQIVLVVLVFSQSRANAQKDFNKTKTRLPTCQTNDCFKNRSNALARAVSLLILILIPSDLSRTAFSDV